MTWSIEDEIYRAIETGKATRAGELIERVISKRLHLPAHRRHLADMRAGKRIAGLVPARRSPRGTAMRIVDQALQRLRKNGDIVPAGRGWRIRYASRARMEDPMTPDEAKAAAAKIRKLRRELERLEKQSAKHCEARAAWPAGTSRARVTTANARWARSAEARDLAAKNLADALEAYAEEQREAVRVALERCGMLFTRDLAKIILAAKLHLVRMSTAPLDCTPRAAAEWVAERVAMDLQERGVVRRTTSGWVLA